MPAKGDMPLSRIDAIGRVLKLAFAALARCEADMLLLTMRRWGFEAFAGLRR